MRQIVSTLSNKDIHFRSSELFIDLAPATTPKETLNLKSNLQSILDFKTSFILNQSQMLEESRSRMQIFTVFFNSINAFLFLLAFYQLLLSIQESLESSKWQIGVFRSMGMTQK